jgi:osmoprotectant transport system ATP-binding protein
MVHKSPSVEIKNVTHTFDDSILFSDLYYSFATDKITAVLGKSGSGKSTLLQIINGMIKPNEGEVFFHGDPLDYKYLHLLRRKIGYVVQHVGLFPHMTIYENISLLGKISKRPEDEIRERILELLDMVNLSPSYLDKFPHELSGGEQQRAGLCRAMLLKPSLLLMDEPFASLDYDTKLRIYDHLLVIQKLEQRTVILVTHDWDEAMKLADEFIWIDKGEIRERGNNTRLEHLKGIYFSKL